MKKIFAIVFLCACSSLVCDGEPKPSDTAAAAVPKSIVEPEIDAILARIIQANRTPETLAYTYSFLGDTVDSDDEFGETVKKTLYWKKSAKASASVEEVVFNREMVNGKPKRAFQYRYCRDTQITSYSIVVGGKDDEISAREKRYEETVNIFQTVDWVWEFHNAYFFLKRLPNGERLVDFLGKPDRGKLNYKLLDYKGKKCLSLEFFEKDKSGKRSEFREFLFDTETGCLLRYTNITNGGMIDNVKTVFEFDKHLVAKGIFFPLRRRVKSYDKKGELYSDSVTEFDEKSVKIDEPIPDSAFIPVLKKGARVHDKILKRDYYATGIAEHEKEKTAAQDLDKIFEASE